MPPLLSQNSAFSHVTSLASQRPVHAAFAWLHGNPKTIIDWQLALVAIPAPTHGEQARAEWLAAQFRTTGLSEVEIDSAGNVLAVLPAANLPAESTGPVVLVSAHLDTVFPLDTVINPVVDGHRVLAPGACDNAAGIAGMLAVINALVQARVELPAPIVVLGNVGEEGEGDLRGVRHFYEQSRFASRIAAHIVLDGRYHVSISGPGGHSFTDAGIPNPIVALARALTALTETPVPDEPRTTLNIGTISGGLSVNSIPESATARVDFRSTDPAQLVRLEVALHRAVEDAVDHANTRSMSVNGRSHGRLEFAISKIGDRPAAKLPEDAPLLAALRAVDRHLGIRTDLRLGSTDANLPLSLGVPALSMGAGGEGGAAHTLREWYSPKDREIALKRILLLTLAMLEYAAKH